MDLYRKYKNDYVPCCFCAKHVNLYYAKSHLKTKKCSALQKLLSEDEMKTLLLKFHRELNNLRSELRLSS